MNKYYKSIIFFISDVIVRLCFYSLRQNYPFSGSEPLGNRPSRNPCCLANMMPRDVIVVQDKVPSHSSGTIEKIRSLIVETQIQGQNRVSSKWNESLLPGVGRLFYIPTD